MKLWMDYHSHLQHLPESRASRMETVVSLIWCLLGLFFFLGITATQLNREAYRKEKEKEFGIETVSESIQKVFISDFGAIIQRVETPQNGSNGNQPPKPVKAILKVGKNRDGKTGNTNLYFDYSRFSILKNEEYVDEFGEVMKI